MFAINAKEGMGSGFYHSEKTMGVELGCWMVF